MYAASSRLVMCEAKQSALKRLARAPAGVGFEDGEEVAQV